jgi:hypothetical protein
VRRWWSDKATEEAKVLWTAFMVFMILCLMGLSIQLGWALIHLLLVVGFGGAGHQPIERVS